MMEIHSFHSSPEKMQEVNDVFIKTEASSIHNYRLTIRTSASSDLKVNKNDLQSIPTNEYKSVYGAEYPRSVFCDKSNKIVKPSKINKLKNFFNRRKISDAKVSSHEFINADNDNIVNSKIVKTCENVNAIKFGSACKAPGKSYYNTNIIIGDYDKENVNPVFKPSRLTSVSDKVYKLGERGSGFRVKGDIQDFYKIRDECLRNGVLWEDPEFPAIDRSLFYSKSPDKHFEWKRPMEIVDDPQFFVEGYSRFDVQQGELGDCWLLAAVANLTLYRRLFFQIVPDDQGFSDKYAGVFHFRFWQYGRWIDVVIDDRLPTYRGQLIYMHSTEENEFWSALLEKAYAKLHGSYEALKGGSTCEAMEDFTGGVTEMYELDACPPNLFKILLKAYERSSLMGCSLEPDPNVLEAETAEGLIRGHAYSITRVKFVEIETPNSRGKIPLLRLRNPWGNEAEWKGPWSDQSPEWRFIPEHEKEEMGLTFDADGEFWMSYKDFQTYFQRLEICNLGPDSLSEEELQEGNKKTWEMSVFEGEWVRGVTAGGCRNYLDTFSHNPQYRITLTDIDEGDDEDKCTVIIALMQKNRRQQRKMGMDCLSIGFAVYHLPYPDRVPKPLDKNFFKYNACIARSPTFINLREVSCRFKLPPGTYCIVPSAFEPNEEAEFLLRVFSENKNNMEATLDSEGRSVFEFDEGDASSEDEPEDYNSPPETPHNPFPPNPYPSNPYPYPPAGGGYPHPQQPSYPYPQGSNYPYPSYPYNTQAPALPNSGYPYPPNPGYPHHPSGGAGYPYPPPPAPDSDTSNNWGGFRFF